MDSSTYEDKSLVLRRSNSLISAKYKTSLIENKIIAIALTKVQNLMKNMENKDSRDIEIEIYPGELNELLGKGKNIYRELKQVTKSLPGHSIMVEDGKGNFEVFSLMPNIRYENRVLTIKFNDAIRPHLFGLQKNYSTDVLSTLMVFKRNSSYRIYELLHKEKYRCDPTINDGAVKIFYLISELRFMIGLANIEEKAVQREISKSKSNSDVDWDHVYEVAHEKMYNNWSELKRCIIVPAQKELKENSDIWFEFEPVRRGSAKVVGINFYLYPNEPEMQVIESSLHDGQYDFAENAGLYDEFVGKNGLSRADIRLLYEKAGYDDKIVRKAFELAEQQEHIDNYMGWLICCIEKKYDKPIETSFGSNDKAEAYRKIREQSHSVDVLERTWNRIREGEDYVNFMNDIGVPEIVVNDIYTLEQRIQKYTDWRLHILSKQD